jgi:hypothetical protein
MSPIGNLFKKSGRAVGNFFKKDVARPVAGFFKKGGTGEQVLRGFSTGIGAVGNVASKIASNPLVTAGLMATAPELLPLVPALALGGGLAKQASQATDIKNYRGQNAQQVQQNILERAKTAKGTVDNSGYKFY